MSGCRSGSSPAPPLKLCVCVCVCVCVSVGGGGGDKNTLKELSGYIIIHVRSMIIIP